MLRKILIVLSSLGLTHALLAQQQPPVKMNVLNVCSPSAEEQQEIASALDRIPQKASFDQDFEVDRGHSLPDQGASPFSFGENAESGSGAADWVRIRREFPGSSQFSTVQYSFSRDDKSMVETLVFRIRDPKDVMQVALEDTASAVTSPAAMLSTDTPASRIKLERFGKSSIVLARCTGSEGSPPPDQSAYEPLFHSASTIAAKYRDLLGVRRTVPEEMARIAATGRSKATKSASKNPGQQKKSQ